MGVLLIIHIYVRIWIYGGMYVLIIIQLYVGWVRIWIYGGMYVLIIIQLYVGWVCVCRHSVLLNCRICSMLSFYFVSLYAFFPMFYTPSAEVKTILTMYFYFVCVVLIVFQSILFSHIHNKKQNVKYLCTTAVKTYYSLNNISTSKSKSILIKFTIVINVIYLS